MSLVLYHYEMSICSQKVRLALEEKGAAYEGRLVNLRAGENLHPDYVRINPRGVVPTLIIDGRVIIDSATIIREVDTALPDPSLMNGDAALIDQWIAVQDGLPIPLITFGTPKGLIGALVRSGGAKRLTLLKRLREANPELAPIYDKKIAMSSGRNADIRDRAKVEAARQAMGEHIEALEAQLARTAYLAGESYTVADLCWTPVLYRFVQLELDAHWKGGRAPRVEAWWGKLQARPSFHPAIKAFDTPDYMRKFLVSSLADLAPGLGQNALASPIRG